MFLIELFKEKNPILHWTFTGTNIPTSTILHIKMFQSIVKREFPVILFSRFLNVDKLFMK